MLVQNTINATLTAYGLGDYLPPSTAAYNAFKYHLENYPTAGGVGASGVNFFSNGLAETVAGSLQMALECWHPTSSHRLLPTPPTCWIILGQTAPHHVRPSLNADPFNIPNGGGFMDLEPGLPGLARQGGYQAVDASLAQLNC